MSTFMKAMTTYDARTENGAVAHSTTGNRTLDLFFNVGNMRRNDAEQIVSKFKAAYAENPELAVRVLLHGRDARGGAGERRFFRVVLENLAKDAKYDAVVSAILAKIPELGRWDDFKVVVGTKHEAQAADMILNALVNDKNGLCAKWMPRKKGLFEVLRKRAGITSKQMRKILVGLSDTVEQKMCARDWDAIDFSKLPSQASARYQKAFTRNAQELYAEYKAKLDTGEAKVNAGAIFPYEIIRSLRCGDTAVSSAQWDALPDYIGDAKTTIMPVVDVSGSMGCQYSGVVTCKDLAISLGIYLAERAPAPFKNEFISFSSRPHFHTLAGDKLVERYNGMCRSGEDMGTNLQGVFDVLLERARQNGLSQEDLPDMMLIVSDMQFDYVSNSYGAGYGRRGTNMEEIKRKFQEAGYIAPKLVFWNAAASDKGNFPIKENDEGVCLVSGGSPAIMKSVLTGAIKPMDIMLEAIMKDRYFC